MIPYSVDVSFDRRPVANWLIFVGVIAGYLLQRQVTAARIDSYFTDSSSGLWLWLIGHIWFHWRIYLLILNCLFLWPLGNAVCAKVGNSVYAGIFLTAAIIGGLLHLSFTDYYGYGVGVPVSMIVGMAIAFFPENPVNCMFLLPRPITVDVSMFFVAVVWLAIDALLAAVGMRGVLYAAHVASFISGIALGILMLKKGMVVMGKGEKSILTYLEEKKSDIRTAREDFSRQRGAAPEDDRSHESFADKAIAASSSKVGLKLKKKPSKSKPPAEKKLIENNLIRFNCPCGKKIKVPKKYAGRNGRCPVCKTKIKIPQG